MRTPLLMLTLLLTCAAVAFGQTAAAPRFVELFGEPKRLSLRRPDLKARARIPELK